MKKTGREKEQTRDRPTKNEHEQSIYSYIIPEKLVAYNTSMNEIWKSIEGYEGLYEVSNLGRVKSLYDGRHRIFREKILKPKKYDKMGHVGVALYKNMVGKYCSIHSLVLKTFIGDRPSGFVIDHINGIPNDNRLENLKYCTQKENLNNQICKQRLSMNNGSHRQEVKDKISKTMFEQKIGLGNKNAAGNRGHSGLKWITNGIDEKCIPAGEQPPENWWFGRKKFKI